MRKLNWRSPLILGLGAVGALYLSACGLVYSQQRQIIFRPTRELTKTPVALDLPYLDVIIPVSTEGQISQQLHGWWIPAEGKPKGTLLYLHGNGLNISANIGLAKRFQQQGLSVLLVDYRGYGLSDGDFPKEEWVYEDARAAWSYLRNEQNIPAQEIVIFGHSLGGAVAIDLAKDHPDAAGLIVQSSFASMVSLAQTQAWTKIFPLDLMLNQRFDSLQKTSALKPPKLWIHGTADNLIPPEMSQQLFEASAEPKQIQLFEGAGHNNVAEVGGDRYDTLIADFLTQALEQSLGTGSQKDRDDGLIFNAKK